MHWFKEIPFVVFAQDIDEIPSLVERCLAIESREIPDWNAKYFDRIPELISRF
jgi:pyruvyl transferase EpsI